jgi:hypothetical protein
VHQEKIIAFLKLGQNGRLYRLGAPSDKLLRKLLEILRLFLQGQKVTWIFDYHSNLMMLPSLSYLHCGIGDYKTILTCFLIVAEFQKDNIQRKCVKL